MEKKRRNKKVKFIMDTDWLFEGILDAEQKQYVLLDYFQKMNKHLERMEVYPMFIELSLHLGNVQTLLNQNKILYTDRQLTSNDDELIFSDLKVKDIPLLDDEEIIEYHKILRTIQPQLHDYFNYAKSIWSIVYDSIDVIIKKNKTNLDSKFGFFYYKTETSLYIWRYNTKRVYKSNNQTKTTLDTIYYGEKLDLTMPEILSKFSKTYEKNKESDYPVFEVQCSDIFPLEETLVPIFKRKILSHINQNVKITRKLLS
jgi:hypothetical protein